MKNEPPRQENFTHMCLTLQHKSTQTERFC